MPLAKRLNATPVHDFARPLAGGLACLSAENTVPENTVL
jgi:hypothetical protein